MRDMVGTEGSETDGRQMCARCERAERNGGGGAGRRDGRVTRRMHEKGLQFGKGNDNYSDVDANRISPGCQEYPHQPLEPRLSPGQLPARLRSRQTGVERAS